MPLITNDIRTDLPAGLPAERNALIQRFLGVPQSRFSELSADIEATLRDLQLPYATGVALDTIGWEKGPLGLRRGRGDDEYRHYLRALPNAFGGQARGKDIRFAIASGIVTDGEGDVELTEDVTTHSYGVTLRSWQGHSVGLVEFLGDYADAPGVTLGEITYEWGVSADRETGTNASTGTSIDLGESTPRVGDTGGATSAIEYEDGFGAFEFDSGYQFDVEESVRPKIDDVDATEHEQMEAADYREADSPLSVAGRLSVGGQLSVENR